MLLVDGKIPMRWWNNEINMGDLLGPWLVEKMTGKKTVWVEKDEPHYMVVGSWSCFPVNYLLGHRFFRNRNPCWHHA
jgi:hypothetical protein